MIKSKIFKGLKATISIGLIGATVALLSGCGMSKRTIGTGAGAVAGGLIGSRFGGGNGQIASTIVGAGAGALAGYAIGGYMDKTDQIEANQKADEQSMYDNNKADQNYYGNDVDYAYSP
jgi:outer membrane lipoprotein SlyB